MRQHRSTDSVPATTPGRQSAFAGVGAVLHAPAAGWELETCVHVMTLQVAVGAADSPAVVTQSLAFGVESPARTLAVSATATGASLMSADLSPCPGESTPIAHVAVRRALLSNHRLALPLCDSAAVGACSYSTLRVGVTKLRFTHLGVALPALIAAVVLLLACSVSGEYAFQHARARHKLHARIGRDKVGRFHCACSLVLRGFVPRTGCMS